MINWISIKDDDCIEYGWYLVAVNPKNYKELSKKDCNDWRNKFGCTKAWRNNGKWFEPSQCSYTCEEITDRVTHWAELPSVPIIS